MKEKRTEKPGVMIYADLRSTIAKLDDAQAGQLFRAILEYGMDGETPQLPSPLDLLWPMIQMRVDADDDRYYDVVNKRSYAAYVRWAKEKNQTPLSYESWLEKDAHQKTPEETPTAHSPALFASATPTASRLTPTAGAPSRLDPTAGAPSRLDSTAGASSRLDPFYQDLVTPSAPDSPLPFTF
jgi:hypothetical protein